MAITMIGAPSRPPHAARVAAPVSWVPAISPGQLSFIEGKQFKAWAGNALASGLGSKAIVRIAVDGDSASEVEQLRYGNPHLQRAEGPERRALGRGDERGNKASPAKTDA